jgi:signal transduction histidine kinase
LLTFDSDHGAQRNTQRLINLVNQLLDLSRFEAGKMVARFRGTDVSKLTANLAALFRSAMHKVRHCSQSTLLIESLLTLLVGSFIE